MFTDPLTLKYLLLATIAIWGVFTLVTLGRSYPAYLLGVTIFFTIAYFALGSGFSIRIPYFYQKMEILVYTVHEGRVHALAHPLDKPGEPMHIVFSINPGTKTGARMRKSFFEAVRNREEEAHKNNIVIDMRGYMTDQGIRKYEIPPGLPVKPPR